MYHTYRFEKLEVWQVARKLKKEIFQLTKDLPVEHKYGIVKQLTRSAGSITANIAEGSGRNTYRDQAHFINLAYSSGLETLDHLITCIDFELIPEQAYIELRKQIDELLNKLNAYYKYLLSRETSLKKQLNKPRDPQEE
jgi:four helix bundle protein